mgnify:FL=1
MIRTKNRYITLENLLIQMIDKGITFVNPFANFDIFKVTGTGYNIDGDDLLRLLTMKYKERFVGREIPAIGRKYIDHLLPNAVDTIENDVDQINYVYKFFYNQIIIFLEENKDGYSKIMAALTEEYNPIENYNMVEYSGSASKVSDTKSTPGNITATTKVAPFTDDNQNLSQTITSALKSTAGYEDASQSMRWADGDAFGATPTGNSVAMQKHTRSGNIGVTTSQQMLEQELKLRADSIVDEFLIKAADTCLLVEWA